MSPGSGVKSKYMKRYREPRGDQCASCYRELLRYRLGHRLLEQAHAPRLWDSWGPDGASEGSGLTTGRPLAPVRVCLARGGPRSRGGPGGRRGRGHGDQGPANAALPEALPVEDVGEKPKQHTEKEETGYTPVSNLDSSRVPYSPEETGKPPKVPRGH